MRYWRTGVSASVAQRDVRQLEGGIRRSEGRPTTKRNMITMALGTALLTGVSGVATAAAAGNPAFPVRRCAPDAVVAGTVCLDKYEASRESSTSYSPQRGTCRRC